MRYPRRFASSEGARRSGSSFRDARGSPSSSSSSPAGVIFMCNRLTRKDCFRHGVFGMPPGQKDLVQRIAPGTMLFLYDIDVKELFGIFEATSYGGMDLEPDAFRDVKGSYPAQVRFDIYRESLPLKEDAMRDAIRENYVNQHKFSLELTDGQVKRLLHLFRPVEPSHRQLDDLGPLLEEQYPTRVRPGVSFDGEERKGNLHDRDFLASELRHPGYSYEREKPSIPQDDFYPPERHDRPIPRDHVYPSEEQDPRIHYEDLYPRRDALSPVLREGRYPLIPRDQFRHTIPNHNRHPPVTYHEDHYPSIPREGSFPPALHQDRYPPILSALHADNYHLVPHEDELPSTSHIDRLGGPILEDFRGIPMQDGSRFSPLRQRRYGYESDVMEPLSDRFYRTGVHSSGIGSLIEPKQGDLLHLNKYDLPSGGEPLNPTAPLGSTTMEEIDQLAMKYLNNDPRFVVNPIIPPFSSTQPDASFGKQVVRSHDLPIINAAGRRSLRRSRWDQDSNVLSKNPGNILALH